MNELSTSTKALLREARGDAPSAAARAKIWGSMGAAGAAGAGVAGARAASVAKAAGLTGSAKLLVVGALFGSAVTVGIATFALRVTTPAPSPSAAAEIRRDPIGLIAPPQSPATESAESLPASPATTVAAPESNGGAPVAGYASPIGPAPRATRIDHARRADDTLAREAALLAEARSAIGRDDPEAALASLRAARALPRRALEPETLALEARALRIEGLDAEANELEARLRARFPENALAR